MGSSLFPQIISTPPLLFLVMDSGLLLFFFFNLPYFYFVLGILHQDFSVWPWLSWLACFVDQAGLELGDLPILTPPPFFVILFYFFTPYSIPRPSIHPPTAPDPTPLPYLTLSPRGCPQPPHRLTSELSGVPSPLRVRCVISE